MMRKKKIQACFNLNFLLKAKVNKSDLMDQTVARASIKYDRYRVIICKERNILVKNFIWACWRVMRCFFFKDMQRLWQRKVWSRDRPQGVSGSFCTFGGMPLGFFSPKYSQKWSPLLCSIINVVPCQPFRRHSSFLALITIVLRFQLLCNKSQKRNRFKSAAKLLQTFMCYRRCL